MKKQTKNILLIVGLILIVTIIGSNFLAISFRGTYSIGCGFENVDNGIITCSPDYGSTVSIDESQQEGKVVYSIDSPYDLTAKQFGSFIPSLMKDTRLGKFFTDNTLCHRVGGDWDMNANYLAQVCSTTQTCTTPSSKGYYTCSCPDFYNYLASYSNIEGIRFNSVYADDGCAGSFEVQYPDGDSSYRTFRVGAYSILKNYFTDRQLAKVEGYILDNHDNQVATFTSYAICDLFGDGSSGAECNLDIKSIPKITDSQVFVTKFSISLTKGGCDETCEANLNIITPPECPTGQIKCSDGLCKDSCTIGECEDKVKMCGGACPPCNLPQPFNYDLIIGAVVGILVIIAIILYLRRRK